MYPGYYLFFMHASVFALVLSTFKKHLLGLFELGEDKQPKNKRAFAVFEGAFCVATQLLLDYVIIPFRAMSLERSLAGWRSIHFIGHIVAFLVLLADIAFAVVKRSAKPRAKTQ